MPEQKNTNKNTFFDSIPIEYLIALGTVLITIILASGNWDFLDLILLIAVGIGARKLIESSIKTSRFNLPIITLIGGVLGVAILLSLFSVIGQTFNSPFFAKADSSIYSKVINDKNLSDRDKYTFDYLITESVFNQYHLDYKYITLIEKDSLKLDTVFLKLNEAGIIDKDYDSFDCLKNEIRNILTKEELKQLQLSELKYKCQIVESDKSLYYQISFFVTSILITIIYYSIKNKRNNSSQQ